MTQRVNLQLHPLGGAKVPYIIHWANNIAQRNLDHALRAVQICNRVLCYSNVKCSNSVWIKVGSLLVVSSTLLHALLKCTYVIEKCCGDISLANYIFTHPCAWGLCIQLPAKYSSTVDMIWPIDGIKLIAKGCIFSRPSVHSGHE